MTAETAMKGRVSSQVVQRGDIGHIYGGIEVDGALGVKDALDAAGLNWTVELDKIRMAKKTGGKLIPGHFATYRTDTGDPLGIVKRDYHIIQNERAFAWIDDFLGSCEECVITSAGTLYGGCYTWVCIDLGGYDVLPGDEVRHHLLIVNSHNGTTNMIFQLLDQRIVCQNVISVTHGVTADGKAVNFGEPLKIRHTRLAEIRMDDVQEALQMAGEQFKEAEAAMRTMAKTNISSDNADLLIYQGLNVSPANLRKWQAGKLPKQPQWVNQARLIKESIVASPGADLGKGTVWGVLNGFTYYFDHVRHVRNSEKCADIAVEQKILRGKGIRGKKLAFEACLKYCSKN